MRPPRWIEQLAQDGAVPHGSITPSSATLLEQLCALGLVTITQHGARRRVVVQAPDMFATWLARRYPVASPPPLSGQRATNIARAGQSKAGTATHLSQPLLARMFSADPHEPLASWTRQFGIVGLTTDRLDRVTLPPDWTLLTVENWETLLALAYTPIHGSILAVFTGGNIADRVIQALAVCNPPRALHLGDYDWAGIAIYRRIRALLPQCELYLAADLATHFRDFATSALLVGQQPLVARADDPPAVQQVLALIAQYNGGLEQEILSLPALV